MNGHTFTWFYVVSLTVLSISATDVFIINARSPPLSVSIDKSLRTVQELLGKKADEAKTLRLQLLGRSGQKTGKDERDFLLRPVSSRDLTKNNVVDLLRLLKANKNIRTSKHKTPFNGQNRLFYNMYGVPKKLNAYGVKKPKKNIIQASKGWLQPFLKYIISNKIPNLKQKFQHRTIFDSSNTTEDYIDIERSRDKARDRYSLDYIDFDSLRSRRNNYPVKAALRTYSVESNDESLEAPKPKAFEIIKNKLVHIFNDFIQDAFANKRDTKGSEADEIKYKVNKSNNKRSKMKSNKQKKEVISIEEAGTSLSSENDFGTKEVVKPKSKKKRLQTKNKPKKVSQVKEDPVAFYLQGNKLYPPYDNEENDTRKRVFVNK